MHINESILLETIDFPTQEDFEKTLFNGDSSYYQKASNILKKWYGKTYKYFSSKRDLLNYIRKDIKDKLDKSDNFDDIATIINAFGDERLDLSEYRDKFSRDEFNSYDDKDRITSAMKTLYNVVGKVGFRYIEPIFNVISESLSRYGFNTTNNGFLWFVIKFAELQPFRINEQMIPLFNKLLDLYANGSITLKEDFLFDESLYKRNENEFEYTVKALKMFSDEDIASKYFYDTSKISEDLLWTKNHSSILPAGINGEDGNTIYNVIEKLSAQDGKRVALRKIIKKANIAEKQVPAYLYSIIDNNFGDAIEEYSIQPKFDAEQYHSALIELYSNDPGNANNAESEVKRKNAEKYNAYVDKFKKELLDSPFPENILQNPVTFASQLIELLDNLSEKIKFKIDPKISIFS